MEANNNQRAKLVTHFQSATVVLSLLWWNAHHQDSIQIPYYQEPVDYLSAFDYLSRPTSLCCHGDSQTRPGTELPMLSEQQNNYIHS